MNGPGTLVRLSALFKTMPANKELREKDEQATVEIFRENDCVKYVQTHSKNNRFQLRLKIQKGSKQTYIIAWNLFTFYYWLVLSQPHYFLVIIDKKYASNFVTYFLPLLHFYQLI